MTAVAGDVPGKFDVIVDGTGYIFDRVQGDSSSSLALRSQRGDLGYTPTFLPRTNISGNYGDDNQDFFLTASQADWSLGEQQHFFRSADTDSVKRYWDSSNVEINIPGEVTLRPTLRTVTAGTNSIGARMYVGGGRVIMGNSSGITLIDETGASQGIGAPTITSLNSDPFYNGGLASDGLHIFASQSVPVGGASPRVRKYVSGTTWTDFSVTPADSLAYHNNSLYGVRNYDASGNQAAALLKYDASGTASVVFSWVDATGVAPFINPGGCLSFGGKLLMLFRLLGAEGNDNSELWQYDGTNTNIVANFPSNFFADQMTILDGLVFIAGEFHKQQLGATYYQTAVYEFDGNTFSLIWKSNRFVTGDTFTGITAFDGGLVFWDGDTKTFKFYNIATGAVSTLATPTAFTSTSHGALIRSAGTFFVMNGQLSSPSGSVPMFPGASVVTSGSITTSLFDFDSSLTKVMRGVTVAWESAPDGDGGTVDISYQLGSVDGSHTSLQASAVSGTEYTFPANTTGRSISIKITLNKSTSTNGPKLKRIFVRAVPLLQQFRRGAYHIDCTGKDGNNNVVLNNGQSCPMDGQQLLDAFITSAKKTTLLSITDNISTYNGIIELDTISVIPTRPSEYIVQFSAREV